MSHLRALHGLLMALAVLTAFTGGLAGCSTARQRDTPEGPGSLLRYRNAETAQFFRHVYRTGNLYVDFRPALVVDAIAQDQTYRRLYVEMLQRQFLLPDAEATRLLVEQQREFETEFVFLVVTYEGTADPSRLTRADAPWKLYLRDDDGQLVRPSSIEPIRSDSSAYLYIETYFSGLDRWSKVYRVAFPKLSKENLGQKVGEHPFQLIMTGVKGSVQLSWEDPGVFYGGANEDTARSQ